MIAHRVRVGDAARGGAAAAVLSGAPSTIYALLTGRDVLEASTGAGSIALPGERRPRRLLLAAIPVHLALSVGWALVLAAVLPRRRTAAAGALAGLGIAAFDLGVVGRRFERIRALPVAPQIADHVTYGYVVGAVLARRRPR